MITGLDGVLALMKNPVRTVEGRVYCYVGGSGSPTTFRHNDYLKSFTIERIGEEGKFFGFGICAKANVRLRDINRELSFTTADVLHPLYVDRSAATASTYFPYPKFYITESHRDENTNELSITCYDAIYGASQHTVSELSLPDNYTITGFISECSKVIGANSYTLVGLGNDAVFSTMYPGGANFEGSETIREALDAVAEATQTIYYINRNNSLTFRRLAKDGDADLTIEKEDYISLESRTNRRLATIVHKTEIGEDIPKSTTESGSTQFIRNNPFWEMREDIETLVENALTAAGGITINQFTCSWRGNTLLEPGDKLAIITKDDNSVISYLLYDTVSYDGTLSEETEWNYSESDEESDNKPTSLGEVVKQTYARVDKANHEIELVASRVEGTETALAAIKITTDDITNSVNGLADKTDTLSDNYEALYNEVQTKMTKDDYTILINDVINESGVDKVITKAGFTFNDEGLTVNAADSEMKTQITEDGMKVFREEEEVLTANNYGVNARNLHANTYLIIGNNSRIEDFGSDRTAIFWIGE